MWGKLLSGVASPTWILVLGGGIAGSVFVANGALAADLSGMAPPAIKAPPASPTPAWSWSGLYIGINNAAFGGGTTFSDPFGASIYGDRASTPGYGVGGQIGYNWQIGRWVYGLETDAAWLISDSTVTCGAFSGLYGSANCGARPDVNGTITGRLGYAFGPQGHTLVYAKGGFAWQHTGVTATNNNISRDPLNNNGFSLEPEPLTDAASLTQAGWTIGAGVEHALTPAWSIRLEYDYLNFGDQGGVTLPGSVFGPVSQITLPGVPIGGVPRPGRTIFVFDAVNPATAKVSSDIHMFKLALNYKLGQDPWSPAFNGPLSGKAPASAAGWEFEGGGRYWYSWGKAQKDLAGSSTNDKTLVSRLTFDDMTASTGEVFGRIDTPANVFLKGYIGGGRINGGHLNDEDWGLGPANGFPTPVSYSNTISSSVTGPLSYGTVDLGYDVLRGPGYKIGAFVGYNRYSYAMNGGGCVQIANPNSDCAGNNAVPASTVGIIEQDTWNSLRVGVSADTVIFDRWKLSGDIAYLPYTKFTGTDLHVLRDLVSDFQGHGQGVQAEAFLSYQVTDALNVGVGGRYWSLWTTSAADAAAGVVEPRNDTFRTERIGAMAQASYRFDAPSKRNSSLLLDAPAKAPAANLSDWTGFYLGVHGGYGWGDTTFAGRPALNARPQGGLGGVQAGYDWQFGPVVAGVESDLSRADIRQSSVTSNVLTIFQTGAHLPLAREIKFDDLATVRARLGYVVLPGVLAYATAGGAWGHSSGTFWGVGGSFADTWNPDGFGWAAGAGIEYRLTAHLLLRGEYLHYGFSSFSYDRGHIDPVTVNGATSIDIARAGLSYKF